MRTVQQVRARMFSLASDDALRPWRRGCAPQVGDDQIVANRYRTRMSQHRPGLLRSMRRGTHVQQLNEHAAIDFGVYPCDLFPMAARMFHGHRTGGEVGL